MTRSEVEIGREGLVQLPAEVAKELRLLRPETFKVFSDGHHCVHLLRLDGVAAATSSTSETNEGADAGAVSLLGSSASFSLADVFSLINMGHRTGTLLVTAPHVSKSIQFRNGQIVYAASSLPEEQLGAMLYRTGKLAQQALLQAQEAAEARAAAEGGATDGSTTLSTVLLEQQLIEPNDLWWGVKYQVEEIVYSVFRLQDATFLFFCGTAPDEARFTIDTNSVLMEGYRRIDEWSRIGRHIPARDVVLHRTAQAPSGQLNEAMSKALKLADGRNTVEDIVRGTGWGEFNTLHVLFELVKAGLLEAGERLQTGEFQMLDLEQQQLLDRIQPYNRAFMLLHDVLRAKRVELDRSALFEAFLSQAPEEARSVFHGVSLGTSGSLDAESLVDNTRQYLTGNDGVRPKGYEVGRLLTASLDGWVAFQCFAAYNLLPSPEARELVAHVRAIEGA